MDFVFILDSSNITLEDTEFYGRNWELAVGFIRNIIMAWQLFGPDYAQMAIVTYGGTVKVAIQLDDYTNMDDLLAAIDNLPETSGGEVELAQALELARTQVGLIL